MKRARGRPLERRGHVTWVRRLGKHSGALGWVLLTSVLTDDAISAYRMALPNRGVRNLGAAYTRYKRHDHNSSSKASRQPICARIKETLLNNAGGSHSRYYNTTLMGSFLRESRAFGSTVFSGVRKAQLRSIKARRPPIK